MTSKKCPECGGKLIKNGEVDENWKFYKCSKCGYELAKVKGQG